MHDACLCIPRTVLPTWSAVRQAGGEVQVLAAVHKRGCHVGLVQPGSVILAPEAHLVDFSYSALLEEGAGAPLPSPPLPSPLPCS